ncbi:hypothetical protein KBX03_09300 [Micromonospora sp. C72]|uniref:hypothetical protein n=1 Tax=Micromonospora sp. C72 TaxID=2824880 RepID=UPI001B368AA9|nr:hypothetical protein [Micromonospora sp. C72]MBQ1042702.1 hypothetical protein [Micromonospora sp. C72]
MSDLPPPGSEPVPPTPSGPPADPTAPPPAATDPVSAGSAGPSVPAPGSAPADPWADQTGHGPTIPHQSGYGEQPAHPNPSDPATPPGGGDPAGRNAPDSNPPGQSAPHGTPPSGWSAPGGTPAPGAGGQSGWTAPGATPPPGYPAMPGYPTPPGYPTGAPQAGWTGPGYPAHPMPGAAYPMAAGYGAYAGWPSGIDPQDPLVNPPHAGIGPWFARCWAALRRGWRELLPIVLLTQVLPATVIGVLTLVVSPDGQMTTTPDGAPALPDGFWAQTLGFYGAILFAGLIFGALQAMGWAAGTWVIARQAAGQPAGLGDAFRYGLSRALGLWGWTIVVSLLVTLGACFCLLPGLYVALALALFGPVHLFERRDPVGRSWQMFHGRFGMVLGRVALVVAALAAATLLDVVLGGINVSLFGVEPMGAVGTAIGAVTVTVLSALVATPTYLVQQVGLVVTYAEQRAQEGPVTAAQLAAELG